MEVIFIASEDCRSHGNGLSPIAGRDVVSLCGTVRAAQLVRHSSCGTVHAAQLSWRQSGASVVDHGPGFRTTLFGSITMGQFLNETERVQSGRKKCSYSYKISSVVLCVPLRSAHCST